jgi:hypothetical protein
MDDLAQDESTDRDKTIGESTFSAISVQKLGASFPNVSIQACTAPFRVSIGVVSASCQRRRQAPGTHASPKHGVSRLLPPLPLVLTGHVSSLAPY